MLLVRRLLKESDDFTIGLQHRCRLHALDLIVVDIRNLIAQTQLTQTLVVK